mmetsp:Transcript_105433/g.187517  ORF Transcript_105433/g.187517 Transcript_105433/m.187517 type:complete len:505 (-) Transcript_105433:22-1536(-)
MGILADSSYGSAEPSEPADSMGRLGDADRESIYASTWEVLTPYIAEFLGTFIITMTFMSNYDDSSEAYFAKYSSGFMIIAIVCATRHITGANLNPCVTIALGLSGRLRPFSSFCLCLTQVLAAISAAILLKACEVSENISLGPLNGHSWTQLAFTETVYTSMLTFVYLNCASSKQNNPKSDQNGFVGLCYGLCYVASSIAARGICDIVSNSAIAVGLLIRNTGGHGLFSTGMSYVCYDLIGAIIGVGAYRVVRPLESRLAESLPMAAENVSVSRESSQMAAEFIGAFYIILTQVLSADAETNSDLGPRAWATAAAVIVMVYSLQKVSGAHFNPAVTLAVFFSRRVPELTLTQALMYVGVQLVAGICASFSYVLVYVGGNFPIGPVGKSTWLQVTFAELIFTFLLCYIVLSVAVSNRTKSSHMFGLAIGSCVTIGGCAIGSISGGSLNPAVSVGIASTQIMKGGFLLPATAYTAVELLGGLAAVGIFRVTHDADLSSDVKFGERF